MAKIVPNVPILLQDYKFLETDNDFVLTSILSQDESFNGLKLASGDLGKSKIINMKISDSRFRNIHFTDVIFANCEFVNHTFDDCSFHRVVFDNCTLVGMNFSKCSFVDVAIQEANGKNNSLLESKANGLQIINSTLLYMFFYKCWFKKIIFKDNDFKYLESDETSLNGIDFSSCALEGFRIPFESLKGSTLSYQDAIAVLYSMGIKIK